MHHLPGLHIYAAPFRDPLMDKMEFLSLSNTFLTFFCGQFLFLNSNVDPANQQRTSTLTDTDEQGISVLIVLVSRFALVWVPMLLNYSHCGFMLS